MWRAFWTKYRQSQKLQRATQLLRAAQAPNRHGIVYLLKAGPFYKIGKTNNFGRRLNEIKLQLPYEVEVVHTISAIDISAIEAHWHRKFAHRRANGEWFTLSDNEVAEFKSYSSM